MDTGRGHCGETPAAESVSTEEPAPVLGSRNVMISIRQILKLEMARAAFLAMLAGMAGGSVATCDFSFVPSLRWAPTPLPAPGKAATASPPARSYRMQPQAKRMSRTWRELTMMWNPFGERHGAGDSEWDPSEPVLPAGQVGGLAAQEMFRRSEAGGKESELMAELNRKVCAMCVCALHLYCQYRTALSVVNAEFRCYACSTHRCGARGSLSTPPLMTNCGQRRTPR